MESVRTETKTASIYKDKNGVINVVLCEGAKVDYYDALDQYLVIKNLSGTERVLKLIDSRADCSILSQAGKFLAQKELKEKTIAIAVVQNSFLKKASLNFFYKIYKRQVPTRFFTDRGEAYEWLMQMGKCK